MREGDARGPRRCRRRGCPSRRPPRPRSPRRAPRPRSRRPSRRWGARPGASGLSAARAAVVLRAAARVAARFGRRRAAGADRPSAARPRRRPARLAPRGGAPSCRLRLCANRAPSSAARSRRRGGARVGGVADRAHHHDRVAPACDHLADVIEVDPADREPRAVAGHARRRSARTSSPAAGRPAFVGVSHTGPTLSWSATPAASAASSCAGECVDSPISTSSPTSAARLGGGHVVLAHVHAVGAARHGQVRPVVQPEQRAVLVAQPPEHGGRAHELVVARRPCRAAGPCPPRRRAPPRAAPRGPGRTSVTKYSRARASRSRRESTLRVERARGERPAHRVVRRPRRAVPAQQPGVEPVVMSGTASSGRCRAA